MIAWTLPPSHSARAGKLRPRFGSLLLDTTARTDRSPAGACGILLGSDPSRRPVRPRRSRSAGRSGLCFRNPLSSRASVASPIRLDVDGDDGLGKTRQQTGFDQGRLAAAAGAEDVAHTERFCPGPSLRSEPSRSGRIRGTRQQRRGPGSNSRKKSLSSASNDRRPSGTILSGLPALSSPPMAAALRVRVGPSP